MHTGKLRLFFILVALTLFPPAASAQAPDRPVYRIGIMADLYTEEFGAILDRLLEETRAVVGVDATLEFPADLRFFNDFDRSVAKAHYKELTSGKADLILVFGTVSSRVLKEQQAFGVPTILFGSTNREVAGFDPQRAQSGMPNFTYVIALQSFEEDLETFRKLTEFEHIGIALEANKVQSLPVQEAFDNILLRDSTQYRLIPFRNLEDITQALDGLDALYLAGGFFLSDSEIHELARLLVDKKIPSFTSTTVEDVRLGLMATNRSERGPSQFIRRMALTVEAWVNGSPLSEQPVLIQTDQELSLNYNTAESIDLPVRFSMLDNTRFIGNPEEKTSQYTYSLMDVLRGGLQKNLGLQSRSKDVELSVQDFRQAKSNYLPNLSANASFNHVEGAATLPFFRPEFTTDGALILEQTLFSPDANANIGVRRNLQLAESSNLGAAELDVVLQGSGLYFNTLLSKINVKILNQNLKLTRENLRIAEQNYQAGHSGKMDVLRFRSELAQNTQSLVEAVNNLKKTYLELNQFLNNPVDLKVDIMDVELGEGVFETYNYELLADILDNPALKGPFVAFLIEEARRNSPELEALSYAFKAVEKNYRRNALGRILPTVGLQAAYNQNFNRWGQGGDPLDPSGFYSLGVNVRLPLFNQYKTELNRQTARIEMDQIEIDRENLDLSITRNVNQGVLNLMNQIANIELSEVSARAAEETLELVQSAYAEGAVNIIQLIDTQNNYLQAQSAQAGATYNFLITAIQLERFIGYNFLLHTEAENLEFRNRFQEYLENNSED